MFVPKKWGHLERVSFSKYGYSYNCMGQWILVQMAARKFEPFQHYFEMEPEELPKITDVTNEVLDEGLEEMLGASDIIPYLYASKHKLLGIGITKTSAEFGARQTGKNLYGRAIRRVLSRRRGIQDEDM